MILRFARLLMLVLFSLTAAKVAAAGDVLSVLGPDGDTRLELTMDDLAALPQAEIRTETVWTAPGQKMSFRGPLLRDVLKAADIDDGDRVLAKASNDYVVEIPVEDAQKYDVILASTMEGQRLDPSDKGPLWVIYPYSDHKEIDNNLYYSRAIWQLQEIAVE